MSGDEIYSEQHPWGLISEFLTLPELLKTRRVSHSVAHAVHDVSPQKCGALLEKALRTRNMHLLPYQSRDRAIQDQPSITDMLIRDVDEHTASLDGMLRCFRVLKHLPRQVAVAFSGKYGRHCIPMEWDSITEQTQPRLHEPCSRRRCRTCRLCVPVCDEPEAEINAHMQIENKHGERMDLTRFYSTCVPNLPHNLICPSCRRNDERTLVLSAVSYRSSTSASGRTLLTYTPYLKEDDTETEENSENDGQGEETPARKKQKMKRESVSFVFPDMHDDVALPTRWQPLHLSNDIKHGIAIHCVSCEQFGIVAPADPCMDTKFPCHDRKRTVMVGKHASTLGGVFVRTKCSNWNCNHPVACEACSHCITHPAYERERAATRSEAAVEYQNRCHACDRTYCSTCSWLATVCHHW